MIPMSINSKGFRIFEVVLKIEIMVKNLSVNLLSSSLLNYNISNFPNGKF